MPDHDDRRPVEPAQRTGAADGPDAARVRVAAARIRFLEAAEERLLDLAVRARDDTAARWLELAADTAWRDARALEKEHETSALSWLEGAP